LAESNVVLDGFWLWLSMVKTHLKLR